MTHMSMWLAFILYMLGSPTIVHFHNAELTAVKTCTVDQTGHDKLCMYMNNNADK